MDQSGLKCHSSSFQVNPTCFLKGDSRSHGTLPVSLRESSQSPEQCSSWCWCSAHALSSPRITYLHMSLISSDHYLHLLRRLSGYQSPLCPAHGDVCVIDICMEVIINGCQCGIWITQPPISQLWHFWDRRHVPFSYHLFSEAEVPTVHCASWLNNMLLIVYLPLALSLSHSSAKVSTLQNRLHFLSLFLRDCICGHLS